VRIDAVNLDPDAGEPLPWQRATSQLDELRPAGGSRSPTCWLSSISADGRPHTAGVVGHWLAGTLYFVSGPRTRKSRNLEADPRCTFAISLPDLDLVLEGTATRVTDVRTLERIAAGFNERGWPLTVEGEMVTASFRAPTAPPPPWHLYAFTPVTALGVATASTGGATRWHLAGR
jgi:hypothetical protein